MVRNHFTRWLWVPVLEGPWALVCGIAAVALPTIVRATVHGHVVGCEFTPYLPFVLLSAILLGWRPAVGVALGSVAVVGGLFAGPLDQFLAQACAVSAAGIFLGSSAIIIAVVALVRRAIAQFQRRGVDESEGGIVFSLEKGEVWAELVRGRPARAPGIAKEGRSDDEGFPGASGAGQAPDG